MQDQADGPQAQGLYDPQHEKDACGVGFVVHLKGKKSHDIVEKGLELLVNLEHRGACGCEANTGDGAGLLLQMPDRFFRALDLGFDLPPAGEYGAGLIFLPNDPSERETLKSLIARIVGEEGQTLLGWRSVPTDDSSLGDRARAVEPVFEQLFIGQGSGARSVAGFSRATAVRAKLYVIRKRIEHEADALNLVAALALLHRQPLVEDPHLQGHADGLADRADVPRPRGSATRVGARARAPALQHEHVPVLAAGAPVPLRRAQRRDQHAARQHQLDDRARRPAEIRRSSATT